MPRGDDRDADVRLLIRHVLALGQLGPSISDQTRVEISWVDSGVPKPIAGGNRNQVPGKQP
jgi:hypothetical protein